LTQVKLEAAKILCDPST